MSELIGKSHRRLRDEMLAVEAEQERRGATGAHHHLSVGAVMANLLGYGAGEAFDQFLADEVKRTFGMLTGGWYAEYLTPDQRLNPGALIGLGMCQGITMAVAARRLEERDG